MSSEPARGSPPTPASPRTTAAREDIKVAVLVILGLCVGVFLWVTWKPATAPGESDGAAGPQGIAPTDSGVPGTTPDPADATAEITGPDVANSAGPRKTLAVAARESANPRAGVSESAAACRELISSISEFGQAGAVAITPESAQAWRQKVQELIRQGPAAVPAIVEFMGRNTDMGFGPEGAKLVGYPSARVALIDALAQVGGPESLSASLEILKTTAEPREVGLLARNLEAMAPGQYRDQILAATRQSLGMAGSGQLRGYDTAPLFEILQRHGGAEAIPELERATGQWKYYATMALAQMPEGAGIPALVSMTVNAPEIAPLAPRDAALEALAQVATQYPEARAALISQVQSNRVPPATWTYLFSILGGDQAQLRDAVADGQPGTGDSPGARTVQLTRGNQNLVYAPPVGGYSPDRLFQQLALVQELLQVTADPNALNVLRQSRMRLEQRLAQSGGATAPGR